MFTCRQLKSFTLIEMILALIISSLVIMSAYFSVLFIFKHYYLLKSYQSKNHSILDFRNAILTDFFYAEQIEVLQENLICSSKESSKKVEYKFSDNHVLRLFNSSTDTFKISILEKKLFYNDIPQNINNGIIDELILTIDQNGNRSEFFLEKKYAVKDYMEYTLTNELSSY